MLLNIIKFTMAGTLPAANFNTANWTGNPAAGYFPYGAADRASARAQSVAAAGDNQRYFNSSAAVLGSTLH